MQVVQEVMDPALKDSDGNGIDDGMEDPDKDGLNRTGLIAKYLSLIHI